MFPYLNVYCTGVGVGRVDIEEELAAIERGECALCRIGANHPDASPCRYAADWRAFWKARAHEDVRL